jgi:hypothetical protein
LVINLVNQFEKIKKMTLGNRGQVADRNIRAVCFCDAENVKPLNEILIWSNYANKHAGVRIGFEFPTGIVNPFKVVKITYQEKRVELDMSQTVDNDSGGKILMQSLETKSKAWKYECEYRLFTIKKRCHEQMLPDSTIEYFLDFKREWIKSIDFGVRCQP